jgi:hypothetical protein
MSPIYEFFRLNGFGVIDIAEAMSHNDEGEATRYAAAMDHHHSVEIWLGKHKVCVVAPKRANPYVRG